LNNPILSFPAATGNVEPMYILGDIPTTPITLGLGVFDGVHLGHQKIVDQSDALLTFMPHPDQVLGKNKDLKYLTTLREQRALVPHLLGVRFTRAIATLPYETFLETLCRLVPIRALVVGEDFCCGEGRQGTPDRLMHWGGKCGVPVHVEPLYADRGTPVKSADIRKMILAAQMREAVALLGHPYPVSGRVIHGQAMGRKLGFPTANLQVPRYKLLPPPGVYGGYCDIEGQRFPSLLYIGYRPTFGLKTLSVEVHLVQDRDMLSDLNLYGKRVSMSVLYPIRGDMTFETKDDLIRQIVADKRVLLCDQENVF
jgi:riboflavin kinase / FMN adenylyltransferase